MKRLFLFIIIVSSILFTSILELKSCPSGEGWGTDSVITTVRNSEDDYCTVVIWYCIKQWTDEFGTIHFDMVLDYWYFTDQMCASYMRYNNEFWADLDKAIWYDMFKEHSHAFPPCSTGNDRLIVTISLTHCYKIVNDMVQMVCKMVPCQEDLLCQKIYSVCIEDYGPPVLLRKDLISEFHGPSLCPDMPEMLDPNYYPPTQSWETPCYTPTWCD
ncbi:MAG: hypothetical protein QXG00_07710 [Candidatus Woesearchaeota archaeon]